jgi:hypothetical protein
MTHGGAGIVFENQQVARVGAELGNCVHDSPVQNRRFNDTFFPGDI